MRRYVLEAWLILAVLCLLTTAIVAIGLWTLSEYTGTMSTPNSYDCNTGEQTCHITGPTEPMTVGDVAPIGLVAVIGLGSLGLLHWLRGDDDGA